MAEGRNVIPPTTGLTPEERAKAERECWRCGRDTRGSRRGGHREPPGSRYPRTDLIESVSPGPYLELFARRNRLGWDTWGNEALEHAEMVS